MPRRSAGSSLSPEERSLRARMAAHSLHATHDSRALTEAARAASPAQLRYWETKVDPDGVLSDSERLRRAGHARSEHYARLAFKAARARAKKKQQKNTA
jgi:hypothetical protein